MYSRCLRWKVKTGRSLRDDLVQALTFQVKKVRLQKWWTISWQRVGQSLGHVHPRLAPRVKTTLLSQLRSPSLPEAVMAMDAKLRQTPGSEDKERWQNRSSGPCVWAGESAEGWDRLFPHSYSGLITPGGKPTAKTRNLAIPPPKNTGEQADSVSEKMHLSSLFLGLSASAVSASASPRLTQGMNSLDEQSHLAFSSSLFIFSTHHQSWG